MDNRERTRLFMAHLRQSRRAKGLCPRCGLARTPRDSNCEDCNDVRRVKRDGGYILAEQPSTHVA